MSDMSDMMKVESDGGAIKAMQDEVHAWTIRKGWRGDDADTRTFGDDVALLHSEVSEALEAFREWGLEPRLRFESDSGFALLPPDDSNAMRWVADGEIPKTEGIGSEFADLLIRLLDCCATYDIDLFAEYRAKMNYNETREHRHGGKNL